MGEPERAVSRLGLPEDFVQFVENDCYYMETMLFIFHQENVDVNYFIVRANEKLREIQIYNHPYPIATRIL